MNELSLFSGGGGFSLGLKLSSVPIQTVGYVENDRYCQQIIQARIRDGLLDNAPIFPDIRTFDGEQCRGVVGIVTAGYPCQPHSVAGQRLGEADDRNLWPDTLRVIREVGPRFVLLENVPGILANGYAGTVVGQLSEAGYDCLWGCVPAAAVGAPHLRWRWWCLAYAVADSQQQRGQRGEIHRGNQSTALAGRTTDSPKSGSADVADTNCESSAVNGDDRTDAGSCGPRGVVCRRGGGNDRRESDTRQDDGLVPNGDMADAEGERGALRPAEGQRLRGFTGGGTISNAECERQQEQRAKAPLTASAVESNRWWGIEPDVR